MFVKDPRERGYTNSPTNSSLGKTQTNAGVAKGDLEMGGGHVGRAKKSAARMWRSDAFTSGAYTHTHTHTHTQMFIYRYDFDFWIFRYEFYYWPLHFEFVCVCVCI